MMRTHVRILPLQYGLSLSYTVDATLIGMCVHVHTRERHLP